MPGNLGLVIWSSGHLVIWSSGHHAFLSGHLDNDNDDNDDNDNDYDNDDNDNDNVMPVCQLVVYVVIKDRCVRGSICSYM